jgi:hypothetical protein
LIEDSMTLARTLSLTSGGQNWGRFVSDGYLKLSEEEKKKIRDFIDRHEGPDMDPFTEMIVQRAKDLIREIH